MRKMDSRHKNIKKTVLVSPDVNLTSIVIRQLHLTGAASTAGPVGGVQSPLRSSQRKTRPVDVLKGSALAAPAHRKKAKDNAGGAGPSSPKKAKPTDDPVSPEMPSATATRLRQKEAGEAAGSPPSKSRKQKDRRKAHYEKK
jgi:hypothetical protein